ncbi:MAG TPA: DUF1800 family protein [Candidatus Acidoferrum sp.]|nr:DUF1800 family protein [Candidatus Acidoferrum sp.]
MGFASHAADTPSPSVNSFTVSNGVKTLKFTPAPSIDFYNILSGSDVAAAFTNDTTAPISNFTFRVSNNVPVQFYSVAAMPMSSNAVLNANVLNRLAYGPSPDDLQRVATIGAEAYIAEQLASESITDDLDTYTVHTTNGVPPSGIPQWRNVTVTGSFSASNLYVYLLAPGSVYIDDIELQPIFSVITTNNPGTTNETYVTNSVVGTNMVINGSFENATLTPSWVVTANVNQSSASTDFAHSGSRSLRLVSSAAGSSSGNSLVQNMTNLFFRFNNRSTRAQLSFWYLEATNSSRIKLRLSQDGIGASGSDTPPAPSWIYATASGTATSTRSLYLFLSGSGECYIDDIKLVAGTVPEVGVNLLKNGDFETPLYPTNWHPTANFIGSHISSNISHSGAGSLKIVATAGGSGNNNSVIQTNITGLVNNATYTVSFWYLPPSNNRTLTVRLSGSRLNGVQPDSSLGTIRRRLENIRMPSFEDGSVTVETLGGAQLHDLRSWFIQNCVASKRQLLFVLLQFLENHFVTQHAKSLDYFDRFYDSGTVMDILATDWEHREIRKWRDALLNPNCTFYDLLKVHIESPAEIVYLDSVDSNGSGNNIANENYAREIMELFCMGVDNGYDQQDITVMSRSWSGWSVQIVDPWNIDNPNAPKAQRVGFYPGVGATSQNNGGESNLVGVWTFNYKPERHGSNRAPVWCVWNSNATNPQPIGVKTVPARFGPPWAGQAYNLYPIGQVPVRTNLTGIQDGYDVATKIAELPFTMEFISVKLCRLFVHDDFENGVYDYADPNRSAEAELIRQCMVAWDTPVAGRKGNIRAVLSTIFSSDLFRTHAGSMQKIKTPLEFAVSAIRALRADNGAGGFTATTDGYSIAGRSRTSSSAPLTRMGSMLLFDRDAPDGYPEVGPPWISAGTLAERVRFVQTMLMHTSEGTNKTDNISGGNFNLSDPVMLLKLKLPSNQWSDPAAVSGFFVGIIYPGEGQGNLAPLRDIAVNFLNSPDSGGPPTPQSQFASLPNTGTPYDTRVRAMVSMLMTQPRFQEQ